MDMCSWVFLLSSFDPAYWLEDTRTNLSSKVLLTEVSRSEILLNLKCKSGPLQNQQRAAERPSLAAWKFGRHLSVVELWWSKHQRLDVILLRLLWKTLYSVKSQNCKGSYSSSTEMLYIWHLEGMLEILVMPWVGHWRMESSNCHVCLDSTVNISTTWLSLVISPKYVKFYFLFSRKSYLFFSSCLEWSFSHKCWKAKSSRDTCLYFWE